MTKKHFIALADAIREANSNHHASYHYNPGQLNDLADFCQSQNPRFDRQRWLGYIRGVNGKNGGKIKTRKEEALTG
jgi:hypothetical protein